MWRSSHASISRPHTLHTWWLFATSSHVSGQLVEISPPFGSELRCKTSRFSPPNIWVQVCSCPVMANNGGRRLLRNPFRVSVVQQRAPFLRNLSSARDCIPASHCIAYEQCGAYASHCHTNRVQPRPRPGQKLDAVHFACMVATATRPWPCREVHGQRRQPKSARSLSRDVQGPRSMLSRCSDSSQSSAVLISSSPVPFGPKLLRSCLLLFSCRDTTGRTAMNQQKAQHAMHCYARSGCLHDEMQQARSPSKPRR